MKIAVLACFCAIQNHAFDMLFALSEVVQHTPFSPMGWNILKAGLNKSVLSSIYTSMSSESVENNSSQGIIAASKPKFTDNKSQLPENLTECAYIRTNLFSMQKDLSPYFIIIWL